MHRTPNPLLLRQPSIRVAAVNQTVELAMKASVDMRSCTAVGSTEGVAGRIVAEVSVAAEVSNRD